MKTISQILRRIEVLKGKLDRTQAILDAPREFIPGPFVTGRSNYPKLLSRRLDAQNERYAKLFKENQEARSEYNILVARIELIKRGEVHPNGQPRKDAPSRRTTKAIEATLSEFIRTLIKVGDEVAIAGNPRNRLTVQRVNTKTITSDSGSKWTFMEITPLKDGEPMSDEVIIAAYRHWKSQLA